MGHNRLKMCLTPIAKLLWTVVLAIPILVSQNPTPEDTVISFVKAWNARQYSKAASMVYGGRPEMSFTGLEALQPIGTTIEVSNLSTTYGGSRATVAYQIKYQAPKQTPFIQSEKVTLSKEGQTWRIVPSNQSSSRSEILGSMAMLTTMDVSEVFAHAKQAAKKAQCLSNIKQLSVAVLMYLYDNKNIFSMNSGKIRATLNPYTKNDRLWSCPEGPSNVVAYSLNANLLKKSANSLKDPANTVLMYEGSQGKLVFRHAGYAAVSFADGHARVIDAQYSKKLRWKP
ncbi:MAG: hypothetical protein IT203_02940 [Fimbriimonadaceae bacterium]|nr:hypothetical protein [Fimbriimonadaceae bacterium]